MRAATTPLTGADELKLLKLESKVAMSTGAGEKAIESLEQIIQKDPLDAEALMLAGDYYAKNNQKEKAEFRYQTAAGISGYEAEAFVKHAQLLVQSQKYPQAAELLKKAQKVKPRDNVQRYLEKVEQLAPRGPLLSGDEAAEQSHRHATDHGGQFSARFWTAPALWRYSVVNPRCQSARGLAQWRRAALYFVGLGWLATLFLFSLFPAHAQDSGAVSGVVVNSFDGTPLPGATVTVRGTTLAGQTDSTGRFELKNLPPGDQVLRISKSGFAAAVVTDVRVIPGQTTTVNGNLRPGVLRDGGIRSHGGGIRSRRSRS
jgi:hypothetical protein